MPMPLWWGQINKRVFNPRSARNGKWQVIRHVGRVSGQTYRTPLEAHRVDDGFIIMLVYGSRCDWVQNVLAADEQFIGLIDGAAEVVLAVDDQEGTGDVAHVLDR